MKFAILIVQNSFEFFLHIEDYLKTIFFFLRKEKNNYFQNLFETSSLFFNKTSYKNPLY